MIQRVAVYMALGLLTSALGYSASTEVFWCLLGLLWCAETIARQDGYDSAVTEAERLVQYAEQLVKRAEQLTQQQEQQSKQ